MFLSLLICTVPSGFTAPQVWQQISEGSFICYFQNNEIKVCQKLLTSLASSSQQLSQQLGIELDRPVAVYLAPSQRSFDELVGHPVPAWSDAITLPASNMIVLKSPTWSAPRRELAGIATHELVHVLLHRALKDRTIPRWLDEGLAVYYSGDKAYASSSQVSRALLTESLLSLDEIDHVLTFRADVAQLAYQQSYLAVVFLIKNYGIEAIRQIIDRLAAEEQFDQALVQVIGSDLWEFEQEWLRYIRQQYRWHFLVDFDNYLWVFVLLLLVAGFILIRRRNRRIIEQWSSEDERPLI